MKHCPYMELINDSSFIPKWYANNYCSFCYLAMYIKYNVCCNVHSLLRETSLTHWYTRLIFQHILSLCLNVFVYAKTQIWVLIILCRICARIFLLQMSRCWLILMNRGGWIRLEWAVANRQRHDNDDLLLKWPKKTTTEDHTIFKRHSVILPRAQFGKNEIVNVNGHEYYFASTSHWLVWLKSNATAILRISIFYSHWPASWLSWFTELFKCRLFFHTAP